MLRKYLDHFVIVYLDDILVYSKTREEHIHYIKEVLQTIKEADLRIKLSKTEFHKQSVPFLGFIISDKGLQIDTKKVEGVTS